ncbi:hypothetical protein WICMUC_002674 [Wickerhamomyces mucosus]|uniref:N-acetyltransferase domain-containing protein n=1 Tax=Wickerhamomyces mucosus TaxID=1378264 RepID=A0A9P8PQ83_9ASCO|nr:hypothetical protein WICMUC_002674 [Wickerhamomyces mucosus]
MAEYRADQHFQALLPNYTVLLKDGETTATIYPIYNSAQLPPGLLAFLADEFNVEVERGDTLPFFDALDFEEFKNYWFGSFAAVMVLGADHQLDHQRQWEKECLGSFFIRANFPGRSSHICTGAFLVNAGIRGKGIGKTLTECYLDWAPKLGYTSTIFNLIYESNVGARRIFESLNFKRVGIIKAAGILKDHNQAVDAIIYGKELVTTVEPPQGNYRFDKIKYYLETGKYPPSLDRQEKSRLRSSASHYKLIDGKLTLNGKEVISDLNTRLQICTEYHRINHGGINKTTSAITERYHWGKIKDTVAQAIRNCSECRDPTKQLNGRKRKDTSIELIDKNGRDETHLDLQNSNSSNGNNSNNNNNTNNSHNQDLEALVQASSHLHRDNLDYSNLEDPSNILVDVAKYQGQQHQQPQPQHYQQDHHHHQQQQQHIPNLSHDRSHHSQQVPRVVKRSYREISSDEYHDHPHNHQLNDDNHNNSNNNNNNNNSQEHHQRQTQHSQTFNQRFFQSDDGHRQTLHEGENEDDIPVDPEVSAFDEHVQGGEIEIARALIEANEDDDNEKLDENDLFP